MVFSTGVFSHAAFSPKVLRNRGSLTLETQLMPGVIFAILTLLSVVTGLLLAYKGYWIGWAVALLLGGSFFRLMYVRLSRYSTITMTVGGFTYRSEHETLSFRWSEVERFWLTGDAFTGRCVCFSLSFQGKAGRTRTQGKSVSPLREVYYIPSDYGLGADRFLKLVTDWHRRLREQAVAQSTSPANFV